MNIDLASFVSILGWALLHFIWQGLLVGMVAWLLLAVLRNARPQSRYAVSYLALLICLLLPMLEILHDSVYDIAGSTAPASEFAHLISLPGNFSVAPLESWHLKLQGQLPWIVAVWSLGAALLSLRMALGLMWVNRVSRSQGGVQNHAWQSRLDRLTARFGMHRNIQLRVTKDLDSPVAVGWWRPVVIVPAALITRLSPDLLEALLAHELAHIKRHDYLINLLQSVVEALLFYHPVVWWLSRQLRIEREQIADDLAAKALGEPRCLALALQELDRFQFSTSHLAPAAHGGNLMSRIQRLIRPHVHTLNWKMALPILGLTVVCLTVYAQGNPPMPEQAPSVPSVLLAEPAIPANPPTPPTPPEPATLPEPTDESHSSIIASTDNRHRQSYALVRAGQKGMTMSGDIRDIGEVEKAKRTTTGDFLWFSREGKAYLIQDPAVLAQATQAWKSTETLDIQMSALAHQMEPHNRKMDALNKQMDALNNITEPNDVVLEKLSQEMTALANQQETLSADMETLAHQMEQTNNESKQAALSQQMEPLQAKMETLQQKMQLKSRAMEAQSQQMETAQQPMEALSRQMEAASQPMEELGRQMEVLGKQQEQLSRISDKQIQTLIDQALKSGKVVPARSVRTN